MSYAEKKVTSHTAYITSGKLVEESSTSKHVTMNNTSVDICARCGQQIYPLELMGQIMGLKYHKQCFKCSVCDRNLDFKTYQTNLIDLADKQIYCASHSPKNGNKNLLLFIWILINLFEGFLIWKKNIKIQIYSLTLTFKLHEIFIFLWNFIVDSESA